MLWFKYKEQPRKAAFLFTFFKTLVLLSIVVTLYKSTANDVVDILFDMTTLSPVYYVYEFNNDETQVSVFCLVTELSTELTRYNEFTITETTTPNEMLGEVELTPGFYHYNVYECDVNVLSLLALSSVVGVYDVIKVGKMQCIGVATADTEYTGAGTTNIVYGG